MEENDMDDNKREILEKRRLALQVKLLAKTYIDKHIAPTQGILDYLRREGVEYQIAGLPFVPVEYQPYIMEVITQPLYNDYGFRPVHLQCAALEALLDGIFERFPSVNPLRYVPDLPQYADCHAAPLQNGCRDGLEKVVQALGLEEQLVYMHFLHCGLVLIASLQELGAHDHEDIFSTWIGEVVIFPAQLDWLIAFTLEEEWLGGRKQKKN